VVAIIIVESTCMGCLYIIIVEPWSMEKEGNVDGIDQPVEGDCCAEAKQLLLFSFVISNNFHIKMFW